MKSAEAKKLVGKEIEWMEHVCPLTLEERLAIKEAVTLHAPTIFEHTDGAAFWADGFTVEALE